MRSKNYLCNGLVSQTSICTANVSAQDYSSRFLNAIYSSLSIKCYDCYTKDGLMSN